MNLIEEYDAAGNAESVTSFMDGNGNEVEGNNMIYNTGRTECGFNDVTQADEQQELICTSETTGNMNARHHRRSYVVGQRGV